MAKPNALIGTLEYSIQRTMQNLTIMSLLARYRFGEARLQEGLAECVAGRTALKTDEDAQTERTHAEDEHDLLLEQARSRGTHDVTLLLTVFEGNKYAIDILRLKEKRVYAFEEWSTQNSELYERLLAHPDLLALATEWGMTAEVCNENLQNIQHIKTARLQMQKAADYATEMRTQADNAIKRIKQWRKNFYKILRLALAGKPELLESVGIKVTRRTRKPKSEKSQSKVPALPPPPAPIEQASEESVTSPISARPPIDEPVTDIAG